MEIKFEVPEKVEKFFKKLAKQYNVSADDVALYFCKLGLEEEQRFVKLWGQISEREVDARRAGFFEHVRKFDEQLTK